jgi:N-acetylneuraminate synthase
MMMADGRIKVCTSSPFGFQVPSLSGLFGETWGIRFMTPHAPDQAERLWEVMKRDFIRHKPDGTLELKLLPLGWDTRKPANFSYEQWPELIPQTMAPFPWHFGGQRYQNIFVKADEIVEWCRRLGMRMCFDVSHSRLTCNHLGSDFYEFAEKVAPVTAHLHLGDAKDLNGEGLQVGEGDIDFDRLGTILKSGCPAASFIPEIWQGHKNGGEGFWIALERLEGKL